MINHINFTVENASPIAMNLEDIKRETLRDAELQKVAEAIHTGRWHKLHSNATRPDSPFRINHQIRNELGTTSNRDIVLRGSRIVMHQSLRTEAIDLAHEGHQGLVKSKKLLRTKVWFLNIDAMMAKRIATCIPCQTNTHSRRPEPLHMSKTPDYAWQEVSADFYGPFQSDMTCW